MLTEAGGAHGLVNVASAMALGLGHSLDRFAPKVKSGDFDQLLLRPRRTALRIAGQQPHVTRLGRMAQGAAVLAWAGRRLQLSWDPATLGLVAGTIAGRIGVLSPLILNKKGLDSSSETSTRFA